MHHSTFYHENTQPNGIFSALYLQLLGVVLSLTLDPRLVPKELSISEILCHSSCSSNGDKMDKFWDSLPVEYLLWLLAVVAEYSERIFEAKYVLNKYKMEARFWQN